MVAIADVVAVVVAVIEVHVERVVRVVSLARPVVVVGPTGPSLIALPLVGTATAAVKVGLCVCSPPGFGITTWPPLNRPVFLPRSHWVNRGQYHTGEAPITLFDTVRKP